MAKAYGFVEITGVTAAVTALDLMCKAADVSFVAWEPRLGGRLCTLIIEGNVAAVTEAVAAAQAGGIKTPVATGVMARPHPEVARFITRKELIPRGIDDGQNRSDCEDSSGNAKEPDQSEPEQFEQPE